MHSVFWTLAKSHCQAAAVRGAGNVAAWAEGRQTEVLPPKRHRSAGDYSYNAFIQESTIDEIAFMGGADPLDLRRKLMAPYPVAIKLIDAIERMSGWKTPLPKDRARGFAFTLSFGTWVAEVVEVSREDAGVRVDKVFCAADAGIVLDARAVRNRMVSDIVHSLSAATGREIGIADASGAQMRQSAGIEIEIELLNNSKHMGNAGEPATPPVMPALANAVFALTGKRLRRLPLADEVAFV